jgi:hypothetical protein
MKLYDFPHAKWPIRASIKFSEDSAVAVVFPDINKGYPVNNFVTTPWPDGDNEPATFVKVLLVQDDPETVRVAQFYSKASSTSWKSEVWGTGEQERHRGLARKLLWLTIRDACAPTTKFIIITASSDGMIGARSRFTAQAKTLTGAKMRAKFPHVSPGIYKKVRVLTRKKLVRKWITHHMNHETVIFYKRVFGFKVLQACGEQNINMITSYEFFVTRGKSHLTLVQPCFDINE